MGILHFLPFMQTDCGSLALNKNNASFDEETARQDRGRKCHRVTKIITNE